MEELDEWQHNVYSNVSFSEAASAQPGHEGEEVIQVHDLNTGELLLEADANNGITLLNQQAPPGECPGQLVMALRWRWCFTYNPCACFGKPAVALFNCGANRQPCTQVANTYKCGG